MKKYISLVSILIMLLGIVIFTTSTVYTNESHPEDILPDGSGTVTTWKREDVLCPDKIKEKTLCKTGGNQQCTAQYCN